VRAALFAAMLFSVFTITYRLLLPFVSLYTDGVTEAVDASGKFYGEDRLLALLNSRSFVCAQSVCETVKADVDAFVGKVEQFDDITMLCLCYNGGMTL